ncbi:NAD(P)/FAD-dependent oxidoreductase [Frigidibacter oleivorans]|uniref:NAD(P)/FAD-dependent oxidoreductase n=1 Tax=Frigidibacter oleivorans TaxID=2487129 RepID=UPI00197AFF63|nr:NAD(P)/FAD-dependent oxidoreductase [Frigidibacter oleivorans]
MYDVIVVGGSYAGQSAALQLLRARRRVLVIDADRRRNRFAATAHGFLGQDGVAPATIARQARDQLRAYPTLDWIDGTATAAEGQRDGFAVTLADGIRAEGRRLLLAQGVTDQLPDLPGLSDRWGRSVFHCPYCHGYELQGGRVGVLANGPMSVHQAELLTEWGPVTYLANGTDPGDEARAALTGRGVAIEPAPVAALAGEAEVTMEDGRSLPFAGLFVASRTTPNGPLAGTLGCAVEEGPVGPYLRTDGMKETSVPGVFACGDIARPAGSVGLAVGDGTFAGASLHRSLVFG